MDITKRSPNLEKAEAGRLARPSSPHRFWRYHGGGGGGALTMHPCRAVAVTTLLRAVVYVQWLGTGCRPAWLLWHSSTALRLHCMAGASAYRLVRTTVNTFGRRCQQSTSVVAAPCKSGLVKSGRYCRIVFRPPRGRSHPSASIDDPGPGPLSRRVQQTPRLSEYPQTVVRIAPIVMGIFTRSDIFSSGGRSGGRAM